MSIPQISVIVPFYNAEKYLRNCLNSICCQTLSDFQLILVDDGSTDSSGTIADQIAGKDTRIQVIHQKNGHLSVARNTGLTFVRGKYVMFIDADDWIDKDMFHIMYEAAESKEMDVVVCGVVTEYAKENRRVEFAFRQYAESDDLQTQTALYIKLFENRLFNYAWNKLYRVSILKKHKLAFQVEPPFEDAPFNMQVFMHTNRICVLPDILYHYMRNDESSIVASYKSDFLEAYQQKLVICRQFFAYLLLSERWIDSFYSSDVLSTYCIYIQSLYKKNAFLTSKERKRLICRQLYENHEILLVLKSAYPINVYQKIFKGLLLRVSPSVMDLSYSIMFFFRFHLSGIYRKFRKKNLK